MILPYEVSNQIIECCGTCFHYKNKLEFFFLSCGVERELVRKHMDLPKFVWARNLLNDLDKLEGGYQLQRRILTEFYKLRDIPDLNVSDRNASLSALRKLKNLARENKLIEIEKKISSQRVKNEAKSEHDRLTRKKQKLEELKNEFNLLHAETDRQKAGYGIEKIVEEMFLNDDIDYHSPYRIPTQQIDGHFHFEGFDYLVEIKWTISQSNSAEIAALKHKIDTKFESTRGIFLSINGFRNEVIDEYSGEGSKIIFFDGSDLYHILDGRIGLKDAILQKVQKAAKDGITLFRVSEMLQ